MIEGIGRTVPEGLYLSAILIDWEENRTVEMREWKIGLLIMCLMVMEEVAVGEKVLEAGIESLFIED